MQRKTSEQYQPLIDGKIKLLIVIKLMIEQVIININ